MRGTTLISLAIAFVLAGLAVFGARSWLDAERRNILANNKPAAVVVDKIVVAREPMRFGERLTSDKVKLIDWPSGAKPVGSFSEIEDVVGGAEDTARFVMSAIERDEPVLASKITLPGQRAKLSAALAEGMKAISIRVNDVLGVAGFVTPGDRVDVMLTRGGYVDILLQGVKVLAIDQIADDRKDSAKVARTVTFEVSTVEAQKLTLGAQLGTLSLALRNVASSGIEEIDRVTIRDLGGGEVAETLIREAATDPNSEEIDQLSDRLNNLERSITEQARPSRIPAAQKKRPSYDIIGVTRGGKRQEYRFDADDFEVEDSTDSQAPDAVANESVDSAPQLIN